MIERLRSGATRRAIAGWTVSAIGLAMLVVPLYDIWDDLTQLGWDPLTTLAENLLLLVLAGGLIAGGVWLSGRDWERADVERVAKWHVGGTAVAAVVFGLVLLTQVVLQGDPKPTVIALDGVLLASVAAFLLGVHSTHTEMRNRQLERERERFAGLFENIDDAVAAVAVEDADPRVIEVNERFRGAIGYSVENLIDEAAENLGTSPTELLERVRNGEVVSSELHREGPDDRRDFLIRFVPYGDAEHGHLYVVLTEVTEQRQLQRERRDRSRLEALHEVTSSLQDVETPEAARSRVLEAVERMLSPAGVRLVIYDESEETRGRVADDDLALSASIGDRGHLELFGDDFAESEQRIADLLGTHLDRTLERLAKAERIREEREQLEFINRTLRHNLLNDIQVALVKLDVLTPAGEQDREHLADLETHVQSMLALIESMRAYTHRLIESEDQELGEVDLAATLQEEVRKARQRHPDAEFSVETVPETTVLADELLAPTFENLLSNAAEHAGPEPTVRVSAERNGDAVAVTVADDGPGVPDEEKATILERGEQGADSTGTGFGLYLVAQAVDAYDGDITVEDAEEGGAAFRVTLPTA